MERVTDAFGWPVRDPEWPVKILITGLLLLIPIAGAINGLGWMLATLDRLRAGEERLAPANFGHLGRGVQLFAAQLVYSLAVAIVALVIYLPAVLIAVSQGRGSGNTALILVSILLDLLAFGVTTVGSLALTFATPAIVLATDRGGIGGGLAVREIVRRSRANPTNTLIAGLMLIAAGLISSLGLIACFIGVLFTTAYALAVQAWVYRSFELGSYAGVEPAS
ncbi:MAG TPA: DUF4013 domain-containing protein [Candidatus Dormibacteraeota bacterium]|nr:DUF4013 domain-containing protein [Candidatus Dormibacteraeota bacterium]